MPRWCLNQQKRQIMTFSSNTPSSTEIETFERRARAMRAAFVASLFKRAFAALRPSGARKNTGGTPLSA